MDRRDPDAAETTPAQKRRKILTGSDFKDFFCLQTEISSFVAWFASAVLAMIGLFTFLPRGNSAAFGLFGVATYAVFWFSFRAWRNSRGRNKYD